MPENNEPMCGSPVPQCAATVEDGGEVIRCGHSAGHGRVPWMSTPDDGLTWDHASIKAGVSWNERPAPAPPIDTPASTYDLDRLDTAVRNYMLATTPAQRSTSLDAVVALPGGALWSTSVGMEEFRALGANERRARLALFVEQYREEAKSLMWPVLPQRLTVIPPPPPMVFKLQPKQLEQIQAGLTKMADSLLAGLRPLMDSLDRMGLLSKPDDHEPDPFVSASDVTELAERITRRLEELLFVADSASALRGGDWHMSGPRVYASSAIAAECMSSAAADHVAINDPKSIRRRAAAGAERLAFLRDAFGDSDAGYAELKVLAALLDVRGQGDGDE